MSQKVKVELVCQMDLAHPMEAVRVAAECRAALSRHQWEALVLLASAVIEEAEPAMVLNLAAAVKQRADRRGNQVHRLTDPQ